MTVDSKNLITRFHKDAVNVCLGVFSNVPNIRAKSELLIRDAILQWADAIRPSTNFALPRHVTFFENCPADYDLKISIGDDVLDPDHEIVDVDRSYCSNDGPTWHCRIWAQAKPSTYVHEVGHALGLFDTYAEDTQTVKDGHAESIMNLSYKFTALQPDDIAGARFLHCQAFPDGCRGEGNSNLYIEDGFYASTSVWKDFVNDSYAGQAIYQVISGNICHLTESQANSRGAYGRTRLLFKPDFKKFTKNPSISMCI